MALLAPAASAARSHHPSKPKAPSPAKHLGAIIQVHNSIEYLVITEFVGEASNYSIEIEHCHNVEATSGEPRPPAEQVLRESAEKNAKIVEDVYMAYNRDVARWAQEAEGWGKGLSKKAQGQLKSAIQELRLAHAAHEKEFFHMRGIWVAMEGVNCAGAEEEEKETVLAGTTAWTKEFKALHTLSQLFHVTKPKLELAFGPYLG